MIHDLEYETEDESDDLSNKIRINLSSQEVILLKSDLVPTQLFDNNSTNCKSSTIKKEVSSFKFDEKMVNELLNNVRKQYDSRTRQLEKMNNEKHKRIKELERKIDKLLGERNVKMSMQREEFKRKTRRTDIDKTDDEETETAETASFETADYEAFDEQKLDEESEFKKQ